MFHLALAREWDVAKPTGHYLRSTFGRSLDDEGFIHCSFADQVQAVADALYRGRDDVVLLTIDPARVRAEIRVEPGGPDGPRFPHIYGPLPVSAVISVRPVPVGVGGRLDLGPLTASA